VHVLAMTATPLPRTLQLSLAGVRDISVIETPPKDRMAVETAVLPYSDELVREAIEFELARGGQVYYVDNRVESIEERAAHLRELVPGLRITVGHGQLDERELYRRMHAFTAREHDLLLATTIIENGIDIPSVNTMIVHRADRFGLAQLYQLRGRVGRSRELGYCYLLVPPTASSPPTPASGSTRCASSPSSAPASASRRATSRSAAPGTSSAPSRAATSPSSASRPTCGCSRRRCASSSGEAVEEGPSATLDLPVPMSIPRSYIGDENLRMEIYRKLAAAETARRGAARRAHRPLRPAAGGGRAAARAGDAQARGRGGCACSRCRPRRAG
jgi:transcription-repair coupling factor (superfamily II helicase)